MIEERKYWHHWEGFDDLCSAQELPSRGALGSAQSYGQIAVEFVVVAA